MDYDRVSADTQSGFFLSLRYLCIGVASALAGSVALLAAVPGVVTAGESRAGLSSDLSRVAAQGLIRGRVTDPDGDPMTQGYARAYWKDPNGWVHGPWASFDEDGDYELQVDVGRAYYVCFHPFDGVGLAMECWDDTPSLPISTRIRGVNASTAVEGIDAELDPGARIEGLIDEYPVGTQGEVSITAYRRDGGEWWGVGWNLVAPWTSPTPYEIWSLPAGNYRVCFNSENYEFFPVFANECVGGSPTPETGTDVEVLAGETTSGADVEIGQASTIRGRVSGISAPVPVQLLTESGDPIFSRLTQANGSYGFSGLPNGSYKLAFNRVPGETDLAARFYRNKPEHAGIGNASVVELGNGELASGNSSTLNLGGSITGRVVDRDGTGVPGCQMRAYTPGWLPRHALERDGRRRLV